MQLRDRAGGLGAQHAAPLHFCAGIYFFAGFSLFDSFVVDSLDEESFVEESLESFESFLSDEDLSSLALSLAGLFPA